MRRPKLRFILSIALCAALPRIAAAERLPVIAYTTQNGLPQNFGLRNIAQDRQGFIWIGTGRGLSRFDGEHFRNYSGDEGLDYNQINALLVRRNGDLIVGTNIGGLFQYEPMGGTGHHFRKVSPGDVRSPFTVVTMHEDSHGVLWVGTGAGLFRMKALGANLLPVPVPLGDGSTHLKPEDSTVAGLATDDAGTLWIAVHKAGLVSRSRTGAFRFYGVQDGLPLPLLTLFHDRENRLWAGTGSGLLELDTAASSSTHPLVKHRYTLGEGIPEATVFRIIQTRDGHIWAATRSGLVEISEGRPKIYSTANGLVQSLVPTVFEDRAGTLWAGTDYAGLMRLNRNGITLFGEEDGVPRDMIDRVVPASPPDDVAVIAARNGRLSVRVDGGSGPFSQAIPDLPMQSIELGVDRWQTAVQDARRRWWVPVGEGIGIFAPGAQDGRGSSLIRTLGPLDGVPKGRTGAMFADREGNIWIGVTTAGGAAIAKCPEVLKGCQTIAEVPGQSVLTFEQSPSGTVWIGCTRGGLFRWRTGIFQQILPPNGHNGDHIDSVYSDNEGRLWFTQRVGVLFRLEAQESEHPRAVPVPGVSAPFFRGLTSDSRARLYLGSLSGVLRYDPQNGAVRRYLYSDGLPSQSIHSAVRDRRGLLWFATAQGLVRIEPRDFPPVSPPDAWLSRITLADVPISNISDRGQRAVPGIHVDQGGSRVQIEFGALAFDGPLKFQYRLERIDRDWSTPSTSTLVIYPKMAAGSYRFLVRAVTQDGKTGQPARMDFEVVGPVWLRWWFLLLTALAIAAALGAVYRYRVAHLLRIEQLRTRIATDLHDDLGASLAHIAIVSEELRGSSGESSEATQNKLAGIAESSREMTASLSDIVWSIRPDQESAVDLVRRMRRVGNDLCDAHGAEFRLMADTAAESGRLEPDVRRQIFLVFKEAIHNALRHGRSERIEATISRTGEKLLLTIRDNGTGFVPGAETTGSGLANMRRRAAELGGQVTIESSPWKGTTITLQLPLALRITSQQ